MLKSLITFNKIMSVILITISMQLQAPYIDEFVDILQTDLDKIVYDYTEILSDRYREIVPFHSVDKWLTMVTGDMLKDNCLVLIIMV